MSNRSHEDEVVARFIEDNPDVRELLYDIADMRRQFDLPAGDHPPDRAEEFAASVHQRKVRYAALLLPAAMGLVASALGQEVREVYSSAPPPFDDGPLDADRARRLERLARKIDLLSYFLPSRPEAGDISIGEAVLELVAIAHGDEPRHFAKLALGPNSRRRANAFRLARHQAHALMWDAYLRAEGLPPKEVKLLVGSAFGEDHTTYSRWSESVEKEARSYLRQIMSYANDPSRRYLLADNLDDAKAKLLEHGNMYRAEKRRQG